ncbi:MAG: hypothetical protein LUF79_02360 [Enterococcus sp.]|nr:hypothetical protein [Enterococcus sp.]
MIEWTARRSLAGISDIEMAGALTGLNKIDMKNGALTGVSTINGNVIVPMNEDVTNKSLAIGTGAAFINPYSSETIYKNAIAIGNGTGVLGDGSLAVGYYSDYNAALAGGIGSIALNGWTNGGDYNVAIGGSAIDADNVVAIGYESYSDSSNAVVIGSHAQAGRNSSVLGYAADAGYTNSVAIGAYSRTTEENQVSFGHKAGDYNVEDGSNFTDDLFRSLVNVADIEMHGALTGVTGIDGVTVSGTDASTGLTVGGNAVIGKTDTPFSSTGFAVAKDGAVTAKTVNGATITGTGFNGVTLSTDGKVNGAAITSNSFNGVTLEKGADSHYKVGGVDVTKMQTDVAGKADAATTLTGYGITDAYTKTETDTAVGKKADKATTLTGYGITDAYTKTAADEKITAATADMATKTQVTADIGTAKTALESAYQAADTALGSRSAALETKTAKFNTAGDNLTGMANITSTAATLGGVGFASAGVMTGVASIDGIAIDASRNLSNAGTYNGVTVAAAGISGTRVFNGAAITNNSFNGVTLEKGADNHYKVGGIDLTALSNGDVVTDNTKGIDRNQDTATTTSETNTKISSSG